MCASVCEESVNNRQLHVPAVPVASTIGANSSNNSCSNHNGDALPMDFSMDLSRGSQGKDSSGTKASLAAMAADDVNMSEDEQVGESFRGVFFVHCRIGY